MNISQPQLPRRDFLKTLAAAGAATAVSSPLLGLKAAPAKSGIKLGYDNFAVRAMNWMVEEHIDYSVKLGCDSLFMSDLEHFKSLETPYLQDVRRKAADQGLQIHVGTWSICPTSTTFRDKWGTAEEHLRLSIRVAQALGSPVIRVILGNGGDRRTEGGIMARIMDTVKVCKACRSQAIDAGVKIAMENHAGDMQAHEVVTLIEEAGGKEYMGANLDAGNAVWTMETPMESLEVLGPYAVTTSLRDSAVWASEKGVTAQWTAMGAGMVDWVAYFKRFAELCPGVPVHIETISGFNREIPFLEGGFWEQFPEMKAPTLARFVGWAKTGKPRDAWKAPEGVERRQAEQDYQKAEIAESIRYCKS
ncbi:MAG TPA: sugar phosphate isomerase/epimerase, partial [Verrucomicrobiales bacterium]|nr:sugar phosphate isomerase/epimerase [Verrucomicrobiales bacterium]